MATLKLIRSHNGTDHPVVLRDVPQTVASLIASRHTMALEPGLSIYRKWVTDRFASNASPKLKTLMGRLAFLESITEKTRETQSDIRDVKYWMEGFETREDKLLRITVENIDEMSKLPGTWRWVVES